MFDEKHTNHIYRSLVQNYKMWITMFISSVVICYNKSSIILGSIQYILCTIYAYLAHRLAHEPIGFFINRAHIYHHEHTDWVSHAIQVCVELAASFSPVVLLYYIMDLPNTIFPFDPYIFLLFFIFYTSVHNINYGLLKVNKTHAKHHEDYRVNYGPDICDIIFKTKYPENGVENTDHYIPNLIISTIITYYFRNFYESTKYKKEIKNIAMTIYSFVSIIVGIFTTKKTIMDIEKKSKLEIDNFNDKVNTILQGLNLHNSL